MWQLQTCMTERSQKECDKKTAYYFETICYSHYLCFWDRGFESATLFDAERLAIYGTSSFYGTSSSSKQLPNFERPYPGCLSCHFMCIASGRCIVPGSIRQKAEAANGIHLSMHIVLPMTTIGMDFTALVNLRESCRKYSRQPVGRDKIETIIESCRLSPSACNSQPWKFVVVDDPVLVEKVAAATVSKVLRFNRFCLEAPVMVALVAEPPNWLSKIGSSIKDKTFYLMDIGIVAEHFCLQATELGLGSCMIGWFDEKQVANLLGVPPKKRIPLLISLGYPAKEKRRKKIRKPMEEIYSYNQY